MTLQQAIKFVMAEILVPFRESDLYSAYREDYEERRFARRSYKRRAEWDEEERRDFDAAWEDAMESLCRFQREGVTE